MLNHFGPGIDASRYARARPRIHGSAIARFRQAAKLDQAVDTALDTALDVGCGTGESATALTAVARRAVGVDASLDMLTCARFHPSVKYVLGSAEHVPFAADTFDIVAAGLSFHWFDADAFLAESNRVARQGGWLLIYTSGFTGKMLEDDTFEHWFREEFVGRFPTPARHPAMPLTTRARAHGWLLHEDAAFSNEVRMSCESFTDYELSTTNIIAAADRRNVTLDEAAAWLRREAGPFFGGEEERTFRFKGTMWCLRKPSTQSTI